MTTATTPAKYTNMNNDSDSDSEDDQYDIDTRDEEFKQMVIKLLEEDQREILDNEMQKMQTTSVNQFNTLSIADEHRIRQQILNNNKNDVANSSTDLNQN
jgi:hypothetical protein